MEVEGGHYDGKLLGFNYDRLQAALPAIKKIIIGSAKRKLYLVRNNASCVPNTFPYQVMLCGP